MIDEVFLPQNMQFREKECHFGGQTFANSLYFSLLAGNSGGEELAPDCALRQTFSRQPENRSFETQIASLVRANTRIPDRDLS